MAVKGKVASEEHVELDRKRAKRILLYSFASAVVVAIILTLI